MNRILHYLHKEVNGLHQAAYLLGFFAFLSQLLALVRDRLFAYFFGASHLLDIYYAAFRIPDFVFASVASVVSISVLIPFFIEKLDKSKEEGKLFIDNVFTVFSLFIIAVATVLFVLTPQIVRLVFPTLSADPASAPNLIAMTRIMLLSPIFLGFSNFLASITQVYKRFFIYAVSPLLYNLGIIFGIVVLYPHFGLWGLALGVALGAICHAGIQLPFIIEHGLFPKFRTNVDFKSIKQIVWLSLPRTIAASSNETAEFFMVSLASVMAGGSISVFNFAWNLQSVPLSIIGVSYSLAAFPALSRHYIQGAHAEFVKQMSASAKHIIFWSIPIMSLFVVLRAQLVRVLLGTGQFTWADTRLTAAALAIFTISLVPQSLTMLFVRSYYARGKTRKPLIINFICAGISVLLGYLLSPYDVQVPAFAGFIERMFKVDGVPGTEVLMLPLAFGIGITLNMLMHWIDFSLDFKDFTPPVLETLFHTLGGSVLMGWVSWQFLGIFSTVFNMQSTFGVFLQGFLAGIIGIIFYILLLIALKSVELKEVWKTLHRKIWKTDVIVPEQSL